MMDLKKQDKNLLIEINRLIYSTGINAGMEIKDPMIALETLGVLISYMKYDIECLHREIKYVKKQKK